MTGPVLVTGATGNLGGATVRSLQAAGVAVRAAARDPEAVARRHPGVEAVRLDFADPATFAPALRGTSGLFLVRPPHITRVGNTLNALIDAADCHVVFASVAGADSNRLVPHHRVEAHLRTSRVAWTVLRPGFFAQNLADAYRADIVDDDRLHVPAGTGRVAFIDVRDIADAAAQVFTDPAAHHGSAYRLTGPHALDFTTVATLLTRELDRTISYQPATTLGYLRHLRARGLPLAQGLVQTVLHVGLRHGQAATVDHTLPTLLRRPARTLRQYIHDHRTTWLPGGQGPPATIRG
ncbi:SDR family oxidoreductase [Saccharothrix mutabilis subsp. mutabilis]|uniref:SDR family oxidoreductase n=1 Tax=Saccharothrix mutabilis subsp. mutabilis TaxID=66855 RepID=A0ABN0TXJ6_9PSEU